MPTQPRCRWAQTDPLLAEYHDKEWCIPCHDSRKLWEMLMLEGFQAGLSWLLVLRKREALTEAFAGFDPARVAEFDDVRVSALMQNAGIIRSQAKIKAVIHNAHCYLALQEQGIDFAQWLWEKVDNQPIISQTPERPQSPLSVAIAKDLKKLGFKFVGPVIVYSWLQAVGVINDHEPDCYQAVTA